MSRWFFCRLQYVYDTRVAHKEKIVIFFLAITFIVVYKRVKKSVVFFRNNGALLLFK